MDGKVRQIAHKFAQEHIAEQAELLRTLGKIPAPSHQEGKRVVFVRDWLVSQGAEDVTIDEANNVVCKIGPTEGDLVAFAAHTDIVFPDIEPLPMTEKDGKLFAPGIGDDTANLVNLLLCAKYLLQSGASPKQGLLLVANSCEEGLGNLDGTKQLFRDYGGHIKAFYSFDGYMPGCTNSAVGSHRYRVTCKTTGGHSFGDWGRPNAIHILSGIIQHLYTIVPPAEAKTTYNVGRIEGGTTVNSIAQEASILYEFRSTSQACLEKMEREFTAAIEASRGEGWQIEVELLGVRPGDGALDQAALAAFTQSTVEVIEAVTGQKAEVSPQSTDSNIPLSLGLPANTIGTVRGGLAHTREEWVEMASLPMGLELALCLVLGWV